MIYDIENVLNKVKLFNSKIITILFVEDSIVDKKYYNDDEDEDDNDNKKVEEIINHEHIIVNNWLQTLEIISSTEYFESEFTPITKRNKIISKEYNN